MNDLPKIIVHGSLGKELGRQEWEIDIRSGSEALHAINCLTGDGIKKYFLKPQNAYGRYKVLINEKEIPFPFNPETKSFIMDNEFSVRRDDIKTIDIVPVLEGAGWEDWLGLGLGLLGLWNASNALSAMISITLIATAISNLLADDPPMPHHQMIENPSSDPTELANSYLFNGPVNVLNEGGPVPIGYGRIIVGSQVIMSSYDTRYVFVDDAGKVI